MQKTFDYKKINSFFFIGIGGISMSAIALFLKKQGFTVAGSDINYNQQIKILKEENIKVYSKHDKNNINGFDAIVYTSAINKKNPEIIQALSKSKILIKRSELLGSILLNFKTVIAISGTHGKTTTTAMLSEVFLTEKSITAFIGGQTKKYGNLIFNNSDIAIVEACEYDNNFLDLPHTVSVVLNVDYDHVDTFNNISEELLSFSKFIENSITFKNVSDENAKRLNGNVTFSFNGKANYHASHVKETTKGVSFIANKGRKKLGRVKLQLFGKHNALNAIAVVAVADYFAIPFYKIKNALENFEGVKRRFELLGKINNANIYTDYAHHPKEINETLKGIKKKIKGKTLIIFEPHTFSRTKTLFNDFITSLNTKYDTLIYKTYSAREKFDELGDAKRLYQELQKISKNEIFYCESEEFIVDFTAHYNNIVILGAGELPVTIIKFLNNK